MTDQAPGPGDRSGYRIRTQGHIDDRWSAWFEGMDLVRDSDGTTVISGPDLDQAALHGLLGKVRDLGLPLISVTRTRPDLDATARPVHDLTPASRPGRPSAGRIRCRLRRR
jgi:hypothetical protein